MEGDKNITEKEREMGGKRWSAKDRKAARERDNEREKMHRGKEGD